MRKLTKFSGDGSLAAVGQWLQAKGIRERVERYEEIRQKVLSDKPLDKLLSALITILAGGHGVVEINTRLRVLQITLRASQPYGWAIAHSLAIHDVSLIWGQF